MSDLSLAASPELSGPIHVGPWRATETPDPLVSLAVPMGGEAGLAEALATLGLGWPAPGRAARAGDLWLMRLGADQALLAGLPLPEAEQALAGAAWLTDQGDVWTGLDLSGADPRPALAFVCPLDLGDAAFPDGACTRTAMAHMAAILLRRSAEAWTIWTPRSSVPSFSAHLAEALELGHIGLSRRH